MDNIVTSILGASLLLLMVAFRDAVADCVDEKKAELKVCFDQLKKNMDEEAPEDVNDFLCSDSQKDRLDCVIRHFNACPDFKDETFIDGLKHSTSGFHAHDLFHVASADEFCKCAPTHMCMEKVETDQLSMSLDEGPWSRIANQEYICGHGRNHIDCVAKSLPTCDGYLQYKHNKDLNTSNKPHDIYKVNVANLEFASIYADKHCKNWPREVERSNCTSDRVGWRSVQICYDQVDSLRKEEQRKCAMRSCIEKAMFTCPKGEMDYFIDAVNVFSEIKASTKYCPSSSASSGAAILLIAAMLITSLMM